jgi:putative transposase
MSRIQRKNHSEKFKARVALEAAKELKTTAELSREFALHANQINQWRRILLDHAPELFIRGGLREPSNDELIAKLYQRIGELEVQLEWLKKKSGFVD